MDCTFVWFLNPVKEICCHLLVRRQNIVYSFDTVSSLQIQSVHSSSVHATLSKNTKRCRICVNDCHEVIQWTRNVHNYKNKITFPRRICGFLLRTDAHTNKRAICTHAVLAKLTAARCTTSSTPHPKWQPTAPPLRHKQYKSHILYMPPRHNKRHNRTKSLNGGLF